MDWRRELIERYSNDIAQLKEGIALMQSGEMEIRTRTGKGEWVVLNPTLIEEDTKTIKILESIIAKAKQGEP